MQILEFTHMAALTAVVKITKATVAVATAYAAGASRVITAYIAMVIIEFLKNITLCCQLG